jgi:peptide/nickel transport system permease protein
MRIGVLVAVISVIILIGRFGQPRLEDMNGRPIATVGSSTPGYAPDNMWRVGLDVFFHLLLPAISLLTISFARYTRYARARHDRGAQPGLRAHRSRQGHAERVVVVRHAFRNVLIPITTLVARPTSAGCSVEPSSRSSSSRSPVWVPLPALAGSR